ncbi:MAG: LPS export ABC transporter ATP-binding protein [Rariglobus sp.]
MSSSVETAPASASDLQSSRAEIQAHGLAKNYGDRAVVKGIDLRVHAGEIVGLLGPNGAGKTTTFYMVVGLVAATEGRVLLDGRDITRLRMHERARLGVGYLPQEASIFRKLTVAQNNLAVVETNKVPRAEPAATVDHYLTELHLTHVARQPAYTLSGGERRRLEIARALVTKPKFLLMDEPFAAIDPISVSEVQKIILKLKASGIGVIITDHNVRETLRIVDRAYLIHEGRVLSEGSGNFLINDPKAREFYLGKDFNM